MEQQKGVGKMGGPACGITNREARGELRPLVGNVQAHRRIYGEGRWTDRRRTGNCYMFWYV